MAPIAVFFYANAKELESRKRDINYLLFEKKVTHSIEKKGHCPVRCFLVYTGETAEAALQESVLQIRTENNDQARLVYDTNLTNLPSDLRMICSQMLPEQLPSCKPSCKRNISTHSHQCSNM